jgi:four helix bundle protein
MPRDYSKIIAWQRAHQLVLRIYQQTKTFPSEERFALIDQMRRAAYSVPANIAEGTGRDSQKDYLRYLVMALGSLKELEYFLLLSKDLGYISADGHLGLLADVRSVASPLQGLIKSVKAEIAVPE